MKGEDYVCADLAPRAGLGKLLLVDLVPEADVLLHALYVVLEIDALQRLLLEVLSRVVEEGGDPFDVLLVLAIALREFLPLGLGLFELRLEFAASRLGHHQVPLHDLQVFRLLLESVNDE